jgi:hypothetical protein
VATIKTYKYHSWPNAISSSLFNILFSSIQDHYNIKKHSQNDQFAIVGNGLGTLLNWPIGGINRHLHTFFLQAGIPPIPIRQLQQFEHTLSFWHECGQSTLQFVTLCEVTIFSALICPSTYSMHKSVHINNI